MVPPQRNDKRNVLLLPAWLLISTTRRFIVA